MRKLSTERELEMLWDRVPLRKIHKQANKKDTSREVNIGRASSNTFDNDGTHHRAKKTREKSLGRGV